MNFARATLLGLLCLCLSAPAIAGELVVAAASDLSAAAKEIVAAFEKRTGHSVKLTLGSSGNFYTQIASGAPFDVFLSADTAYVRQLQDAGLTERDTTYTYGVGRIVLWVPQNSPVDIKMLGMKALLQPNIRKVAIANPEHAPYGRAAVQAMERAGVYTAVKSKLVTGENIAQAAQFVQSGAADAGIIALALALSEPMQAQGRYWEIPLESYSRMDQAAVILKQAGKSGHSEAARAFLETLRSKEGQTVLRRYGFFVPEASVGR